MPKMPTKRLNISLVDQKAIKDLRELRKILQNKTDREEISFADIIKSLIAGRPDDHIVIRYL